MQLHELQPKHKNKTKKRIGRGGKRGTFSGKGVKGQKSRAGRKLRPGTRDLMQQTPKLRGARNYGPRGKSGTKPAGKPIKKDDQETT
ncbi:MAG: hypothetical protein Q8P99_00890 [bacterium]|nr:hypothetical protein [bacterium]MDZ4231515.1 hypothetical protein [Patescibacteria group bacterium]